MGKFTYKRRNFFYLYAKSSLTKKKGKEIEDAEIDIFCSIASDFIEMDKSRIKALLEEKELFEVNCDE
ncbi:MAG TPA: hypothetical protein DCE30_14060 [Pantoea sp.]|nr:hypothetical protein [Pantoea sp.]HAB25882.1 hypothetical protein [Pantoea sp.]